MIRERLFEHKKKATVDLLTRLNNEHHMQMFLPKIIETCKSDDKKISLNLIDIERFSDFNKDNGHELSDNLLAYYGKKIKELGQGFVSWRIGSDEFLVVYTYTDEDDKAKTVNKLVDDLRRASLKPKGREDTLAPLYTLLASGVLDKSMSVNANLNFLYAEIEKQKSERAKDA